MNRTIKEALRIAQRRNKPIRFHQTIARRGYATDGAVEGVPDEESQEKFLKEQLEGSAPQYDPEAGLLTGKRAGLMAAGFAPGSGIATAAGKFPTAEGGYEPSVREDIREKRYGSAALKALGAAGDVAYAAPVVGPVVGAAMKAPLAAKLVMAAAPIAKAAHEIAPVAKAAEEAAPVYKTNIEAPVVMRQTSQPFKTGWHGSPYRFAPTEKNPLGEFLDEKINTGEGFQSFGHGHYLGEERATGEDYKNRLANTRKSYLGRSINEPIITGDENVDAILDHMRMFRNHDVNEAAVGVHNRGMSGEAPYRDWDDIKTARDIIKSGIENNPGHLYEVDIHADPNKMLDWDAPLSEQPNIFEKIKDVDVFKKNKILAGGENLFDAASRANVTGLVPIKLKSLLEQGYKPKEAFDILRGYTFDNQARKDRWISNVNRLQQIIDPSDLKFTKTISPQTLGRFIVKDNDLDPKEVSNILKGQGIEGIKYWDELSRPFGSGTRNFTVFDPSLLNIKNRYKKGGKVNEQGSVFQDLKQEKLDPKQKVAYNPRGNRRILEALNLSRKITEG